MTSLPKFFGAKPAPGGRATRLTLPSEININDKVIFKSPKNRSLKARGLQPEQPNTRSLQVSEQDRVSLVNTDLQEFLTNKWKLEPLQCQDAELKACVLVLLQYSGTQLEACVSNVKLETYIQRYLNG